MKLNNTIPAVFDTPATNTIAAGASLTRLATVEVSSPRTPAEWDAAARLVQELSDFIVENTGVDPEEAQRCAAIELDDLEADYAAPHGHFLVARLNGEVVGTTGILRMAEPGVVELKRVYVRPEASGHHLASLLLDWAPESARPMGAHCVRLETASTFMQKAVSMYRSYGFVEVAHYRELATRIDGLLSMECRLAL